MDAVMTRKVRKPRAREWWFPIDKHGTIICLLLSEPPLECWPMATEIIHVREVLKEKS